MAKLLLKYAKEGRLRFLSHLEVAKSLERVLRRSELPLAFSDGFHPRPKLSFGPALPLGASGLSEYAMVVLTEEMSIEDVKNRLNSMLPEGLRLLAAEYIPLEAPSLGRLSEVASYEVLAATEREIDKGEIVESIAWLFKQASLVVRKANGDKVVERTIAVLKVSGKPVEGGAGFRFLLSVGKDSIRPDQLAAMLIERMRPPVELSGTAVTRSGIYTLVDSQPVDVLEYYKNWHPKS